MKTRSTITLGLAAVVLLAMLGQAIFAPAGISAFTVLAPAAGPTVQITGSGLNPGIITVQAGQAVAWVNTTEQVQHLTGGQPARVNLPLLARTNGGTARGQDIGGSGVRPAPANGGPAGAGQAWGGDIAPGASISVTFANTGTYDYYLAMHPNCVGRVVVVGPGTPLPDPGTPVAWPACALAPSPTATSTATPSPTTIPQAPAAPALQPIANPSKINWYTVAWTPVPGASAYRLEEDDNAAFSHPAAVYTGEGTQWNATGKAPDKIYYYRVQASNTWGNSAASGTQSTSVQATPDDPGRTQQWWLGKIGAIGAWAASKGRGVTVAVVDSGVDLAHPDLQAKIVPGYNFVAGNENPQDDNGHGSHVAGIAAAVTGNAKGVAGLGWEANIMPVKVLDSSGSGSLSDVISGIEWAADHGAQVINLSLGADGGRLSPSTIQAMQAGADYAWSKGSLLVAAAGNCGDPATYTYNGCQSLSPASYPAALTNVLGVGATTTGDTRATFSSYGAWVDVAAPGDNIYSTYFNGGYATESGTSMASPVVAGLAALVWGRNPALTNAQVAAAIMQSSVDLGTPGRDDQYGQGRIDAAAAVGAAASGASASSLAGAGWEKAVTPYPAAEGLDAANPVEPGVVLVKLKPGRQAMQGLAVRSASAGGILKVDVPAGQERSRASALAASPDVEFAVPDYRIQWITGDPAR